MFFSAKAIEVELEFDRSKHNFKGMMLPSGDIIEISVIGQCEGWSGVSLTGTEQFTPSYRVYENMSPTDDH